MKSLLAITFLTLFAPAASAQLYVPDASLRGEIQTCQNLWPDLAASDTCLLNLALQKQSKQVCNYIHDNNQHLQCHRSMPQDAWNTSGLLHAAPLVVYFLVLIAFLAFRPPRGPYITGMLVGMFIGLLFLYLRSMPFEWVRSVEPYLPYLAAPVDGLMRFSPAAFMLWPFGLKFVAAHVIVYGSVVGTLFQGENRSLGFLLLVFALLLTYWDHPFIAGIRSWFQAIVS